MQSSINSFVAGPKGEMDWMTWDWDDEIKKYVMELTKPVDCILLGANLAKGFIDHWAAAVNDPAQAGEFPDMMNDRKKIVFSKSITEHKWERTTIAKGDLVDEVNKLKNQDGGDLITYGGAGFATSLIKANLIDEYHLFVNPAVIDNGMTIFNGVGNTKRFELVKSQAFPCGIVVLNYKPKQG